MPTATWARVDPARRAFGLSFTAVPATGFSAAPQTRRSDLKEASV
jgi:hypothetical protein